MSERDELERLRIAAEDEAGGPPSVEQVESLVAYSDKLGDILKKQEQLHLEELRAARAETWDEAISTIFAWWSAPEQERPAGIVNPYGVAGKLAGSGPGDIPDTTE